MSTSEASRPPAARAPRGAAAFGPHGATVVDVLRRVRTGGELATLLRAAAWLELCPPPDYSPWYVAARGAWERCSDAASRAGRKREWEATWAAASKAACADTDRWGHLHLVTSAEHVVQHAAMAQVVADLAAQPRSLAHAVADDVAVMTQPWRLACAAEGALRALELTRPGALELARCLLADQGECWTGPTAALVDVVEGLLARPAA